MPSVVDLAKVFIACSRWTNVAPFLRNRYSFHPLLFILLAIPTMFLSTFIVALFFADRIMTLFASPQAMRALNDTYTGSTIGTVGVPFSYGSFCAANITMTSLYTTALVAMVAWMVHRATVAWGVYIVPMIKEVLSFEDDLWADPLDLRLRVPMEDPSIHVN